VRVSILLRDATSGQCAAPRSEPGSPGYKPDALTTDQLASSVTDGTECVRGDRPLVSCLVTNASPSHGLRWAR
jgi:hypothetical protein